MNSGEPKDCALRCIWVADHGLISRVIGGQGRGFWAHMAIRVGPDTVIDARDRAMPIPETDQGRAWAKARGYRDWELIDAGVQSRPISYLDVNQEYVELEVPCTATQLRGVYDDLTSQEGKPYDSDGILCFARSEKAIDRHWRDQSAWFCDELAMWTIERRGICRPILMPIYRMTPGFAFGKCEEIPGSHIVRWRGDYVARAIARGIKRTPPSFDDCH